MKEITKRLIDNFFADDIFDAKPTTLNVEVTDVCNLRCVMCPTHTVKRKKGMMDVGLFSDVLDEAVEMGIKQVGLHTVGESILHPKITEFIRLSKAKGVYTYMDVNGNRMSDELIEGIIDAGLDSLKFSMDGHSPEIYNKIRVGGDFNKVFANLKKTDEARKRKNSSMRLYALYIIMKGNEAYIDDFKKVVGPYVDEVEISMVLNQGEQFENYEMLVPDRLKEVLRDNQVRKMCPNPWKRITVTWDGYLTACCIDFEGSLIYAKYEKGKLKDLWNCARINEIRENMKNYRFDGIEICRNCQMIFLDIPGVVKVLNEIY